MKKKVVFTEDDENLQQIVKSILEKAGYEVEVYSSGQVLLDQECPMPDLFLLDKHLPGSDGIDICKHLKLNEKTRHIPVIMISANPRISLLSEDAGANAYIEKPFNKANLLQLVMQLLETPGEHINQGPREPASLGIIHEHLFTR